MRRLVIVPISYREACKYVVLHHRHHIPPRGHKASLGLAFDDAPEDLRGVAILGRPVSRELDDGKTLEVTRVATDGVPNGCSKLYGACWKLAQALGYRRLVTYTLASESGASLRAVGWRLISQTKDGRSWSCPSRPRVDKHPLQSKLRWEVSV